LEELSLRSTLDETEDGHEQVSLMTIHNGKGLEFDVTFLVGLEENLFPHVNSKNENDDVEEERRLFYVGMTRAKEFLYLSFARTRLIWGAMRSQYPSRFIREIPFEYVEKIRPAISFSKTEPKKPKKTTPLAIGDESFQAGDSVFHKTFGVGIIREVYEGNMGVTYKAFFPQEGAEKTLIGKYAPLVKL
jgi:DNA helicase-2/ATP-dependent DNA helicase PcrA